MNSTIKENNMTAAQWLEVIQQAQDYNKEMTPLIIKYGELLIEGYSQGQSEAGEQELKGNIEDEIYEAALSKYLKKGIYYGASTIKKADIGDLEQLVSDSFFYGAHYAVKRYFQSHLAKKEGGEMKEKEERIRQSYVDFVIQMRKETAHPKRLIVEALCQNDFKMDKNFVLKFFRNHAPKF